MGNQPELEDGGGEDRRTIVRTLYEALFVKLWELPRRLARHIRENPNPWLELAILAAWTAWFAGPYLDFNPNVIPGGREFGSSVQTHFLWENLVACGWCAFWNGAARGGVPAFADVHGSMLHPLVALSTLLFGVINGTKVTLLVSFWLAGVAQWWLAKELSLGWVPRMWSAMLVIVAGHLGGRMELGALNVVVATASGSLVFPAVLAVHRRGGGKAVVLLAAAAAGAILGGSGYMQVGLIAVFPAFAFLLLDEGLKVRPAWKDYARAGLLALLLSAPFLLSFAHFYPNFLKDVDADFRVAQPFGFLLLNLMIDDPAFYQNEALGKFPFPHLYTMFVGWAAVVLAIVGAALTRHENRRMIAFLGAAVLLGFFVGSADGLRWLVERFPGVAGVRHPPQIAGLAVPPLLALAAYGLDRLLGLDWPTLRLEREGGSGGIALTSRWLLAFPLVAGLLDARAFSQNYIFTEVRSEAIYTLLEGLKTPGLEWVNPPFGEHFYIEPAIAMGLKLSPGIMSWRWEGREAPFPVLEANRAGPPPGMVAEVAVLDGVPIYARSDQPYAAIYQGEEIAAVCSANGIGGWIDVRCRSDVPGRLIVRENMWSGWRAWRADAGRTPLLDDLWLEVEAPAGEQLFLFRYLPWDAPLGIALAVVGVVLCVRAWKEEREN